MFTNYFKIAFRGFVKHKLTFFINLFGLAMGLWAAILIGLWVRSELNMDKDFAEIERVYRIMEHQNYGSDIFTTTSTPGLLGKALKEQYPEIDRSATYTRVEQNLFVKDENKFKLNGFYAGEDYLHILQYPILHGDREVALSGKSGVVLSSDAAIRLFGKTDIVGEFVTLKETEGESSFMVQAVLEPFSSDLSSKFDFILPFQFIFDKSSNSHLQTWGNNGPNTIVKLEESADYLAFSDKIENFLKEKNEGTRTTLFAYPQGDLYLFGKFTDGIQQGGRIENLKLFSVIGIFILLIACINFMNLSTAKSQKRAKEVGVRKVVGAGKFELVGQFLSESLLLTIFAGFLALILVQLTLPVFNNLTEKTMTIPFGEIKFWAQFLGIIIFTGLVAGSYPAFYLSATKVVSVFKSFLKTGSSVVWARKGLVTFQFILATVLIVGTVVVYQQINFALKQNLGYDKDQLIRIQLEGKLIDNFDFFKTALHNNSGIKSVSRSSHAMVGRNLNSGDVSWEGKDPDFNSLFEIIGIDYDYLETMGFELIQGGDFLREKGSDSIQGAILNRRAYELITQDNPDAVSFTLWSENRDITGVLENFHFQSFHEEMEPVILLLEPSYANLAYVKIDASDIEQTIASIKATAEELDPDFPFTYSFMDENYAQMYSEDLRTRDLAKYFSILTILISCLGLLGLSAHIAEQKTKEIGIRKVLGASTLSILHVINKEFIAIVSISIVLGSVLSIWIMRKWLANFAYRIDFEWWFVPFAAFIILFIAYLTVTLQALRSTQINPSDTLKSE